MSGALARALAKARGLGPALRGQGRLEDTLVLLGVLGGGVFLALALTLLLVQAGLGRAQRRLAGEALPAEQRIARLEASIGAAFRRQEQISATVDLAQLEPLRDRRAVEEPLRAAGREIAASLDGDARPSAGEGPGGLVRHLEAFLAADASLLAAVERRHTLQAAFEDELGRTDAEVRALVAGSEALTGLLRLERVLVLRELAASLERGAARADLVRSWVFGDNRGGLHDTTELGEAVLRFGWSAAKLGVASSVDAVNSIAANELPQSRARIDYLLMRIGRRIGARPDAGERLRSLSRRFAEIAPRVLDERRESSLIALRRRVLEEAQRAAAISLEGVAASQRLAADAARLQGQVAALARGSVRSAAITSATAWLFSIAVALAGLAGCLVAARRIAEGIDELQAQNRKLTGLKEKLITLNASLDARVEARTGELSAANHRLEDSLAQLHQAQRQLMEASRRAGMADVATAVLHNVGNALNSVNVSAGLVIEQVRGSKAAGLAKANQLLREHQADLPRFLAEDERGRRLPQYLEKLADALGREQRSIAEELGGLQKNIDHVRAVVARQQSHAKNGALLEELQLHELAEDALRMSLLPQEGSGLELVRDLGPPLLLAADRHKVSQILLNLLTNARHAVRDGGRASRRITLRARAEGDWLAIAVEDDGCGIAPENLTRIFSHGFTTKADGHGFGLHSSACAAAELGGALRVHSDGPGRGATFTLTLPLRRAAA